MPLFTTYLIEIQRSKLIHSNKYRIIEAREGSPQRATSVCLRNLKLASVPERPAGAVRGFAA